MDLENKYNINIDELNRSIYSSSDINYSRQTYDAPKEIEKVNQEIKRINYVLVVIIFALILAFIGLGYDAIKFHVDNSNFYKEENMRINDIEEKNDNFKKDINDINENQKIIIKRLQELKILK